MLACGGVEGYSMDRTIIEGAFEWGTTKNKNNIKRHKMELKDGIPVFDDEHRQEYQDDRSDYNGEIRYLTIGYNNDLGILSVCFTEKTLAKRTRLISVREASKREKRIYTGGL